MSVGAFFDMIIWIAIPIFFIYLGVKTNKKSPDKTIKVFKPVKLGKILMVGGVVMLIVNLLQILFQ